MRTPWRRKASYGAELYKRKKTVEASRRERKEKKSTWWIWVWAGAAAFLAVSSETLGMTSGESKYWAGLAVFFVIWGSSVPPSRVSQETCAMWRLELARIAMG
jgi:hypothetical protein